MKNILRDSNKKLQVFIFITNINIKRAVTNR